MQNTTSIETLLVAFMRAISSGVHKLLSCNYAAVPRFACCFQNENGELNSFERFIFYGMAIGAPAAAILVQRCDRE